MSYLVPTLWKREEEEVQRSARADDGHAAFREIKMKRAREN